MPRFDRSLSASSVFCALAVVGFACAGGSSGSSGGSGGAGETGGATGSGGAFATGGSTGSGGSTGNGGATAQGGATGSGGAGPTGTGGASNACASCAVTISSYCQTGSSTTEIKVTVDVADALISPLPLANVTFRYWFVIGGSDTPMLSIDYAQIGSSAITSKFVAVSPARTGANEYLEVGFATNTSLTLFGDTGQIQLHAHTANYSAFDPDPTSDYSYRPCGAGDTGTTYSAATTITGYVNGQLAWGTEPQ